MEKVEIQKLIDERNAAEKTLVKPDEKATLCEADTNDTPLSIPTKPLHEEENLIPHKDSDNRTNSEKNEASITPSGQRRRGILKRCEGESPIQFIDPTGPWFRLQPPDLNEIKMSTRSGPETAPVSDDSGHKPEGVRFNSVQVRLYGQTLGDNPAVTNGAPIQLDWCYNEHPPIDLNLFHAGRTSRPIRQLVLSRYYRHKILMHWYNFSELEIDNANQEAKKIRKQRQQSQMMSEVVVLEECLYSISRVMKGMFRKK